MKKRIIFDNPIRCIRQVSHDLSLKQPLLLSDGSSITALEAQWEILESAQTYIEKGGAEWTGGEIAENILNTWTRVLTLLESDPDNLRFEIDWIAKKVLLEHFADRHNLQLTDPKVRLLALQYHDIRKGKRISEIIGLKRLVTDLDVSTGVNDPPEETRAYFRGICLQRWPESIVSANWDSLVFRIEGDHLKRVPILDPNEGSAKQLRTLLERVENPAELIAEIESSNR